MQKNFSHRWNITEISLSVLVLFIVLLFTYGIFVRAPYAGFMYNPTDGHIQSVFNQDGDLPALEEGDILVRVGHLLWSEYYEDRRQDFFDGMKPGDQFELVVKRGDQELTIPWEFPGFNQQEFNWRFFNIWWLGYIYWLFGTVTLLFMRPRDTIRSLLIAANYLTGLLLIFGCMSAWHLWESSILLHAVTWLVMAVYLHLHWIFPHPLYKLPKWVVQLFYAFTVLLVIAEFVQVLPKGAYAFAFLFALVGSAGQQVLHFIKRPEQRREVRFLAISVGLVIAPFIGLLVSGTSSRISYLTFLSLPFMPLSYFYVIYRRQMGGQELRANRLVSSYAFLIILGTVLLFLLKPATVLLPASREAAIFLMLVLCLIVAFGSINIFPAFQAFVEQWFMGIKLPYENLQEMYSSRIAASASLPILLDLLKEEVFPSILIRQFAFIHVSNGDLTPLLVQGVSVEQLPLEGGASPLAIRSGKYIPTFSSAGEWIRLILPLKVGDVFLGFWLLGRRDPDDLYALAEIPILQSIANQTAIALSNIQHAEQLRKMYQLDIERYEQERLRLALDLHDSILNQLAVMRNNLSEITVPVKFQTAYEELTRRLREIVSDLRPPMLMYGLKPAIEELADNLMERVNDQVKIKVDMQIKEERYPPNIEQHLYRIVQEACENALRHSKAKQVTISAKLLTDCISLLVEDDGVGFKMKGRIELDDLIAGNHFGLIGIVERAMLIGAQVEITSIPGNGTQVQVIWDIDKN